MVGTIKEILSKPKLSSSFLATGLWYLIVFILLIHWQDSDLWMPMLIGTAAGWAAGVLLAPYKEEEERFQKISTAVSGIIGGYLLGKADRVYDLLVDKGNDAPLLKYTAIFRGLEIFVGCFVVSTLAVFVARTYWQVKRSHSN
jgi:hypothetical protein